MHTYYYDSTLAAKDCEDTTRLDAWDLQRMGVIDKADIFAAHAWGVHTVTHTYNLCASTLYHIDRKPATHFDNVGKPCAYNATVSAPIGNRGGENYRLTLTCTPDTGFADTTIENLFEDVQVFCPDVDFDRTSVRWDYQGGVLTVRAYGTFTGTVE